MHAVDRGALADALSFGSAKPTVQFFAQSSPVYDPALETIYPFDQKKAKALLAEAGHKDGIEITQLLLNTTEYKQLGEALQAMLAEVRHSREVRRSGCLAVQPVPPSAILAATI